MCDALIPKAWQQPTDSVSVFPNGSTNAAWTDKFDENSGSKNPPGLGNQSWGVRPEFPVGLDLPEGRVRLLCARFGPIVANAVRWVSMGSGSAMASRSNGGRFRV